MVNPGLLKTKNIKLLHCEFSIVYVFFVIIMFHIFINEIMPFKTFLEKGVGVRDRHAWTHRYLHLTVGVCEIEH